MPPVNFTANAVAMKQMVEALAVIDKRIAQRM
jgi:hypothetical protein